MGIPAYFSHIIRNHKNIVTKLIDSNIHFYNMYMDCNSIIYDCVHSIKICEKDKIENLIINLVIKKIDEYITLVNPSNTIYIAFDGVAPFAKMEQQRNRRFKTSHLSKILKKNDIWNTVNITPGTKFMNNLMVEIEKKFLRMENKYNVNRIIVSTSRDFGEGEHKLFNHIRENPNIYENIIIYGLDADLIMLSIFNKKYFKNIFICRESPEFLKCFIENDTFKNNECLLLNINNLSNSILNRMGCKFFDNHRIYDYAFLCFFLGNDFLPHFPSMNIRTHGIDVLLNIYNKHIAVKNNSYLISKQTMKIEWKNVYILIKHISLYEHKLLLEEHFVRDKFDYRKININEDIEKLIQNVPIIYRFDEKYICPTEEFWEERYYKNLFNCDRNSIEIKNICLNYLEGLEWVYKYYTIGCINWKWKYNYHYPPLFKDLLLWVPRNKINLLDENYHVFSSTAQLCYVLSLDNLDLLPDSILDKIKNKYLYLYPDNVEFKWAYCRYFWESHACLPEIPLKIMEDIEKIK